MDYKDKNDTKESNTVVSAINDEILDEIKQNQIVLLENIDSSELTHFEHALDAALFLLSNDFEQSIQFLHQNDIIEKIVQKMNFESNNIAEKSMSIISNIVDTELFSDNYQELFNVLSIWIENAITLHQLAGVLEICTFAIKKDDISFGLFLHTDFIFKLHSRLPLIPLPSPETTENDNFYLSLYYFFSKCYKYQNCMLPLEPKKDFINYLFNSIPHCSLDLLSMILKPLINGAKNHLGTLSTIYISNYPLILDVLANMQKIINDNQENMDENLYEDVHLISHQAIILLFYVLSDEIGIDSKQIEQTHLIDVLKCTFDMFPSTRESVILIISNLISEKVRIDQSIPFDIISSVNNEFTLVEKSAIAYLFKKVFFEYPSESVDYVYEHLDVLDGILEILTAQIPQDILVILETLNYIIWNAAPKNYDIDLIRQKLDEHDITPDFIQEIIDDYPDRMDIYETCNRFLNEMMQKDENDHFDMCFEGGEDESSDE